MAAVKRQIDHHQEAIARIQRRLAAIDSTGRMAA